MEVGKIHRPHGVHGEVLVAVYTDFPGSLSSDRTVYAGMKHLPMRIRSQRPHNDGLLLAFEGCDTPESVGHLRNQLLYIARQDASPLAEGEHYFYELAGIQVQDEDGRVLGTLSEVLETGANDVYVVRDELGNEVLLPAIPEVILKVDVKGKRMVVHILPGLLGEA